MSNQSQARYGSDLMADMLRTLGIEYAAINPGSSFRGLHDSIVNHLGNKKPEVILCCHEGIAVAMAHGYGKVAGKPMAAIVHNVVGLLHATTPIYNAWLDQAPILVIGGTGPMATDKRRPWIDWIHTALVQGNAIRDYVKWDDQPFSLAGIPDCFIRAYQVATTEPGGPVYICLDAGLQEELLTDTIPIPPTEHYPNPSSAHADSATIDQVAKLLVEAKNPVVIADYMGRDPGAVAALIGLAEFLALSVVDVGGRFNFPSNHPADLTGAERELLREADIVLALDVHNLFRHIATMDGRYLIAENCRVVHITLQHLPIKSWTQDYGKLLKIDIPITADTALALPALTAACRKLVTEKDHIRFQKRFNDLKAKHKSIRQQWEVQAKNDQDKSPVSVPWLMSQVWEVVKDEDWVLVNGDLNGCARRLWNWEKPYQYVGKSMLGCGLGHSLGAALAHQLKERLCIDLQKDGDFLYTPEALWTAAHHHIPLLVIMENNRSYYNSENHQASIAKARGRPVENKNIGTRLDEPSVDYAGLARSFGLHGEGPIEHPNDLRPALQRAITIVKEKRQLALVDVVTRPSI